MLDQYMTLIGIALSKLNGTICGHLRLPEVPKITFQIHEIQPSVSQK